MDNLGKSWQKLAESLENEGHLNKTDILRDLRNASEQPLQTIIKGVRNKLWFSIGFCLLFVVLIFVLPLTAVKIFMGIVAASYLVVSAYIKRGYEELKQGVDMDQPSVEAIQNTLLAVQQVMRQEMIFYVVTFPFSLTGGFLAGISAESGNLDLFTDNPWVWAVLAGCHVVFFPVGYWLAKKMNERALGKYIRQLEELIETIRQG
jgi:hypothetical protein